MDNILIKEIDYGIAFTVTDGDKRWIEVNKHLKNYPRLYKNTLSHELKHIRSKNKHIDFGLDLKDAFSFKNTLDIFNFTLHHPKALLASSPIFYENRKWSVNWFMVVENLIIIGLITGSLML